ncbi:peptidoglycan-binding protein [Rhizobium sp. SSA_523]|uniref:peptidoglycan-binding protein n=1 Tax=Rhizobium sp. SSA_523 TaxID=2952477 RepID=UPI00209077C7|nr:peptidoglycan-binding protein [Rhizobium sp. SSA_523]MCO5732940.1 peptidoglycan-binding protein [Rhizobium sp. SSA_523]WKC23826.1 peptidoglycan-binding protein [Rhizobium sp. SSA_523]
MNGSRLNSQPRGERSSLDALNRTIEGLEARIEDLLKASGRDKRALNDRPGEAVARHQDGVMHSAARTIVDADTVNEIRQRQRALDLTRQRDSQRDSQRESQRAPQAATEARADTGLPSAAASRAPAYRAPVAQDPELQEIAQAFTALRRELKADIAGSIAQEMASLRGELRTISDFTKHTRLTDELRDELMRLAEGVDGLSQRTPSGAGDIRAELEELRRLIDGLASADSLHRMEARWTALEDRFEDLDAAGIQKELIALAYRIDGVKAELGTMIDNPSIRALEDKILTLAAMVEDLGARPAQAEAHFVDHFSHLDQRLDEISRAVAVGARPRFEAEEQAAMGRLEERLALLTDSIDSLAQMQDAQRLEERLEDLASAMHQMPQAELTSYLSDLSRKIDALGYEQTSHGLAGRLDDLSRRLDELGSPASGIDRPAGLGFERIEERLDEIAARLDEAANDPIGDNQSIVNLERQIAHLSSLLSEPRGQDAASLPGNLDQRIASIESYMSTSDEYILEAARHAAEAVIESYAHGSPKGSAGPDTAALAGLAQDLRHLEDLARSSEERTQATFDGLHRTLVKIAERLDRMEGGGLSRAGDMPPAAELRPPMAAAVTAQPVKEERPVLARASEELLSETAARPDRLQASGAEKAGLLSGLTKRLRPKAKAVAVQPVRADLEPAPAIEPADAVSDEHDNELLEPGSGMPDVRKILERVRASQMANPATANADGERVDYIAAARRAAKAAAQESDPSQSLLKDVPGRAKASSKKPGDAPAAAGRQGIFGRHRRPILMAVGAILLALMAMPLVNTLTRGERSASLPVTTTSQQKPADSRAAPSAPVAERASETQGAALDRQIGSDQTASAFAPPAQDDDVSAAAEPAGTQPPAGAGAPDQALAGEASPAPGPGAAPAGGQASAAAETAAEDAPAVDGAPAVEAAQAATAATAIVIPETIGPKSLADAAAKGDPQALFEIGARYTEGRAGLATDAKEAARWYQLAADQGFAPAQYRLGSLYEKGTGVARDIAKAMDLYRQAAGAGNASSMHNLAVLYASGAAGTADFKSAVEWFEKAADHGITDSQFNLAILYARGNGTAQNLEESYKWFAIAARNGDKDAAQKRDEVANALKPEQLQSAKAKADTWKPQPLQDRANGVNLPDEWVGKGQTTASIDMEKAVRNIQAILNKKGYDAGQPDGRMGKKTVAAIKAFQKKNGLPEDGTITEPMVRKLLEGNETKGA